MNEICGDNRFEIIAKAKAHLLDATNIDTSEEEMKVLDSFLFRCWQMGWLDRYDRKTEQTEPLDKDINVRSKTEPQTDEDCDYCKMTHKHWYEHCDICKRKPKDEPQTDIHDLTDCDFCKDRNCKDCEGGKDEPQTEDFQDWKDQMWAEAIVTEPQTEQKWTCARCGCVNHADFKWCFKCGFHKSETDQTDCAWK